MKDVKQLYNERLGRFQSAMALKPTDRVPISLGFNQAALIYGGNSQENTVYDPEKTLEACRKFHQDFPEIDTFGVAGYHAPYFDAVGCKFMKFPGRDLPVDVPYQYIEKPYMSAEEYDEFIEDPTKFLVNVWLPRICGELEDKQSPRYALAIFKNAMALMQMKTALGNRNKVIAEEFGVPPAFVGGCHAAFDELSDKLRDLQGIIGDMRRRPEKVKKACEVINPMMITKAVSGDPARIFPSFLTTHKPMFMSPKEFEDFYWPTLKEMLLTVWDCGVRVRILLEGDWSLHAHHLLELPKGSLLCDIDMQMDIKLAKEILGGHHCIAGGLPDPILALAPTSQVDEHVHYLCETIGRGGGFMINAGGTVPYNVKPENMRAVCDAVMKYGWYDQNLKHEPIDPPEKRRDWKPLTYTGWDQRLKELGGSVTGDGSRIGKYWDQFESQAMSWVWSWL